MAEDQLKQPKQAARSVGGVGWVALSLGYGLAFGVVAIFEQALIYLIQADVYVDAYWGGVIVGFFGHVTLASLVALLIFRISRVRSAQHVANLVGGALLLLNGGAYSIHAASGSLPAWHNVRLTSLNGLLGWFIWFGAYIGFIWLWPTLAQWLQARLSSQHDRVMVSVCGGLILMLACANYAGARGQVYYGSVPPLLHVLVGRSDIAHEPPEHAHRHHKAPEEKKSTAQRFYDAMNTPWGATRSLEEVTRLRARLGLPPANIQTGPPAGFCDDLPRDPWRKPGEEDVWLVFRNVVGNVDPPKAHVAFDPVSDNFVEVLLASFYGAPLRPQVFYSDRRPYDSSVVLDFRSQGYATIAIIDKATATPKIRVLLRRIGFEHILESGDDRDLHALMRAAQPLFVSIFAGSSEKMVKASERLTIKRVRSSKRESHTLIIPSVRDTGAERDELKAEISWEGKPLLFTHYDIPELIREQVRSLSELCSFGLSSAELASNDHPRWLVGTWNHDAKKRFLFDGRMRWIYHDKGLSVELYDEVKDPKHKNDLFSFDDPQWPEVQEMILDLESVLNTNVTLSYSRPIRLSLAREQQALGKGFLFHFEEQPKVPFERLSTRNAWNIEADAQGRPVVILGEDSQAITEFLRTKEARNSKVPRLLVIRADRKTKSDEFKGRLVRELKSLPANDWIIASISEEMIEFLSVRLKMQTLRLMSNKELYFTTMHDARLLGVTWVGIPAPRLNQWTREAADEYGLSILVYGSSAELREALQSKTKAQAYLIKSK